MILVVVLGGILGGPGILAAADLRPLEKLFKEGHYSECAEQAAAAIANKEPSERCRILQIRAELELGRYAEAAKSLAAAQQVFPQSIELRWLGRDVWRFNNQPDLVGQLEDEMVLLLRQAAWRYSDPSSRIVLGKLLLTQGLEPKRILEGTYNVVKKQQPEFAGAWLAAAELALDKTDYALAAENFDRATKLDATAPDAFYGLARAFAPSDSAQADEALKQALELNPNHVLSLLMLAESEIDSEHYVEAEKLLDNVESINPHQPRSLAYRAVLAHLRNQPERETAFRAAALKFWKSNPEVDFVLGKKLSQKYRFAEGAAAQRRALEFDSKYLPAQTQLSQDLLRLGQEEEGWKLADAVYKADGYNIFAHNLVTLQETVAKFRTLEADGVTLRMDAREAGIYGPRVMALLKRAKATLGAKYQVQLPAPIVVEMFPRQQDFAIRTFGMPGGDGFLGVCFGTVITANSPASQADHPTCWEATLWHEFCHVVTLNKTRNRMPRWLSEGISVYEERLASPAWGQSINPRYRKMLLGDELTPVSRLSGAFLRPKTPLHLQFAYYEASLVVEYLVATHGFDALLKVLDDLGAGVEIHDALGRQAGSAEELDRAFADYARKVAESLAPDADWSEPELPLKADRSLLSNWVREHPQNYPGLLRLAKQLVADKQWEQAKEPLEAMRRIYPDDPGEESLYGLLARVHRGLSDLPAERTALAKLVALSPNQVAALDRLSELATNAEDWGEVRIQSLRWLAVNPLQPAPYRRAVLAAERLGDDVLAAESLEALLRLDPLDPSDLRVRLGRVRLRSGDWESARREALLALERTPRFRAAHKLLLDVVSERDRRPDPPPLAEGSP
ncbi:MAG: hypothetical protein NT069_06155 [Planctomycetota bacterium]|nr:hypothetical protein [Planctomycetota bacterium]